MDAAIWAKGLGKQYLLAGPQAQVHSFREAVVRTVAAPAKRLRAVLTGNAYGVAGLDQRFWALRDVDLEVPHGQVLGIIGRNGAGKSTLLKILSRITEPTTGRAEIHGRVGSLLEVGTGFHADLTGRENVYLNGTILGMTRTEIDRKFDEIVRFSEIEKFIETPVKYYSSGMWVRLGFAVAAHLDPEILIVDEVLAVGDQPFQKKCLGQMRANSERGRTVVLVSHDMAPVLGLCGRVLWIDQGRIRADGDPTAIVGQYLAQGADSSSQELATRTDREGNGKVRFTSLRIERADGTTTRQFASGEALVMRLGYHCRDSYGFIKVRATVTDRMGRKLLTLSNEVTGDDLGPVSGDGVLTCRIPRLPLLDDDYDLELAAIVDREFADVIRTRGFTVTEGDYYGTGKALNRRTHGLVQVDHAWEQESGAERDPSPPVTLRGPG